MTDYKPASNMSMFKIRSLRSIISGPLDVDKLDYIQRDAHHIGVMFGHDIDENRLLRNLTICFNVDNNDNLNICELGVTEKAIAVAETVWRARRHLFRQVYWHHSTRSLKAMLMFVVRRILINLNNSSDEHEFKVNLFNFVRFPLDAQWNIPNSPRSEVFSNDKAMSPENDASDSFYFKNSSYLTPFLCSSDNLLISFLSSFSDDIGKNILNMIRTRKLYKRVAVLSHKIESTIFDSIYNRTRQERLYGDLRERENRRINLENNLLDVIDFSIHQDNVLSGLPIILFDVPLKALKDPDVTESLCYVPEEELGLFGDSKFSVYSIAKKETQIEGIIFDKEVGKIRVLAHPDFVHLIKPIPDEDIISCLIDA